MKLPARTDRPAGAPSGFRYLSADSLLGPTVRELGPREIVPAEDLFARMVQSVVRQQISMSAADAIFERLVAASELTPAGVRATDREAFRAAGLSERKVDTILAIADAFDERGWTHASFGSMSDDEVIAELTTISGVGVWTAKMQLMFALGRPDIFPVEDLGIRRGVEVLVGEELTRAEMVDLARRWRPYRSLASLYVWEMQE